MKCKEDKKFPIREKIFTIEKLVTTAKVVQKTHKQRIVGSNLNPSTVPTATTMLTMHHNTVAQRASGDLLTKEESEQLHTICNLFISSSTDYCASATRDENITQEVHQCILDLLEGKRSLADTKQQLNNLKEKDQRNIRWPSAINGSYKFPITTAISGIFTIGGLIATILMLTLAPLTWPLVAMFVGPVTLLLFALTTFLFWNEMTYRQERVSHVWEGYSSLEGIDKITIKLTENDVALLKKIHSPEWNQQLETLKAEVTPPNTLPAATFQNPLANPVSPVSETQYKNTPAKIPFS
jgi:hypothetical protein